MVSADRKPVRRRRMLATVGVAIQILSVFWIVYWSNIWGFMQSWRVDLTRDKRYEVPPETRRLLEDLDREIEVIIPLQQHRGATGQMVSQILARGLRLCREFEQISVNFHVRSVFDVGRDPSSWESIPEHFGVDQPNRIYLVCEELGTRESLGAEDLADLQMPTITDPNVDVRVVREHVAETLGSTLVRLVAEKRPVVYFTAGSGEIDLQNSGPNSPQAFAAAIRDRGYTVRGIDLRSQRKIPDDADLVITVAGGTRTFHTFGREERRALEGYIGRGGSYLLFLPTLSDTGLEMYLEQMAGIGTRRREYVAFHGIGARGIQRDTTLLMVTNANPQNEICKDFEKFRAVLGNSHPLEIVEPAQPIITSDRSCWLETDATVVQRDANDPPGPFVVGASSELPAPPGEDRGGRVVVYGSWQMAGGQVWSVPSNRQLLLNSVYWLTERKLIAGQGRDPNTDRILLDATTKRALFIVVVFVMPIASILLGLVVFAVRRRS